MTLAKKFKEYLGNPTLNIDFPTHEVHFENKELIMEHLKNNNQSALITDKNWEDSDGKINTSLNVKFKDGSVCNIHEWDIEIII